MNDLDSVLRRYPAACQPTRIESLGAAGGMSGAQFWRLVAPGGTLVLRRWPKEHPTPDGLRFIHAVLAHATRRGIDFLPQPIAASSGETFVLHAGHLWELAPWLSGSADFEQSPRTEKLQAALRALARFHRAVADFNHGSWQIPAGLHPGRFGIAPAIATRLTLLGELQAGGTDVLAKAINDAIWPELAPLARQFLASLPDHVPDAVAALSRLEAVTLPLQPCIRDIWHDHVLFDGDEVTGFIDFGAMRVDTPSTDIARLVGSCAMACPRSQRVADQNEDDLWRAALSAYSESCSLSAEEVVAIPALDAAGTILAGCNWIRWGLVELREFPNRPQIVRRFARLLARMNQTGNTYLRANWQ